MKTCYIGHEYHRKTASTNFLADFLEANSTEFVRHDTRPDVEVLDRFDIDALIEEEFDLICVFQIEMLAKKLADRGMGARLIFVPMYDGCWSLGNDYWKSFAGREDIRVVNFSATLHTRLARLGVNSYRFQYFPEPGDAPQSRREETPRQVFYWQRTDRPSWDTVKTLFDGQEDMRFHLHLAGDPSLTAAVDVEAEKAERDITVSTWFEHASEYRDIVGRSDIYVAPREFEGIGMSFLEAMAAGKCVVAPDNPTMNEYITHGVNGLLYDVDDPRPLDFSRSGQLGEAARRSVIHGHRLWQWDFEHRLRKVLFDAELPDPAICQEVGGYVRAEGAESFPRTRVSRLREPKVSVAVVCYNSESEIEGTLQSILAQTYPAMEVVVVDGQSTDGTLGILERYRPRIDILVSEEDGGVYDAMNKAATLATGDYIIFINAGDFFHLPTALEEALDTVFGDATFDASKDDLPDFIVGHHVYLHDNGASALHKANDFDNTWEQLQTGTMSRFWWSGIPCHQATLTRRALLAEEKYDLSFKITADHSFMFTMRSKGKVFAHSNSIIATYVGGGISHQHAARCISESFRVSVNNTPRRDAVETFYLRNFGPNAIIEHYDRYEADADLLRESGLFYEEWYRMKYIRPSTRFQDPVMHFLMAGWREGCQPNPFFDPQHYLMRHSDVYEARLNPFMHYLRHGRQARRPTYDWESTTRPLSPLRRLFRWHEQDIEELEEALAAHDPAQLHVVMKGPLG